MKKVMRMVVLSAMLFWGAQAMAQTRGAIFFGASIPTGDFGKFDNMNDFALTTTDATYAGAAVGFNAGIKWYFNVGVKGLGAMLSIDGFYNSSNSDLKTAYRSGEVENNYGFLSGSSKYNSTPKLINLPAMLGVNYIYEINPQFSVYAETGLGGNYRMITTKEHVGKLELLGIETQQTTTQKYDGAFSFAWQIGAGVEVAKNLLIGASFYDLGKAEVKGDQTVKRKTNLNNTTTTEENYLTFGTVRPKMFLVRVGFSF